MAKIWAEVWSGAVYINEESISDVISAAKGSFKQLVMVHHPDKGGDSDKYISITDAYDTIKSATISDFVDSLKEESNQLNLKQANIQVAC